MEVENTVHNTIAVLKNAGAENYGFTVNSSPSHLVFHANLTLAITLSLNPKPNPNPYSSPTPNPKPYLNPNLNPNEF